MPHLHAVSEWPEKPLDLPAMGGSTVSHQALVSMS